MDWVGRADVILLAVLFSCAIIIFGIGLYRCYLTRHQTRTFIRDAVSLLRSGAFHDTLRMAERRHSPVSAMVLGWADAVGSSSTTLDVNESIGVASRAFWRSQRSLNAKFIFGLSTLKSIAYVAPFLGLAGECLIILSGLSRGIAMEKHAATIMIASEIAAALIPTTVGLLAAAAGAFSYNYLRGRIQMLQSEISEKALETVTLIPHPGSQGKQLIIGPSWCDREKRGLFRLAQSLPLRRPFSEMQPYALVAAPSLGIFLAVLMAFLSFHTAVGFHVRLLKPDKQAKGRWFVPTVVIRSSGTASDRKNVLYVNATETSREELGVVVKRELGINSANLTYVEAEGDVSWQTVADAIDVVNAIPADVILVTKAPEKTHPRRTP
jgi:biopolymer transport protein ExbB/TolQ